jgi:hypothetical protein
MRLYRFILAIVIVGLFINSVNASTTSTVEPFSPLATPASFNPFQSPQPKLYREHIYAGDQLVTSVSYPDLQAANQGLPGVPLAAPEPAIIAANTDPQTQRWLVLGNGGLELLLLFVLAVTLARRPGRTRWLARHHSGWRRRFVFASGVVVFTLSLLPLGAAMLADSSPITTIDFRPLSRTLISSPPTPAPPVLVQSGTPVPVPGDPTWNQYQTHNHSMIWSIPMATSNTSPITIRSAMPCRWMWLAASSGNLCSP